MFPKSNKKNFQQYENDYKKAFITFFKFLTSESEIDVAKRKFVLECVERFKDVEEYDSAKEFFLEVFEEIGCKDVQKEEHAVNFTIKESTNINSINNDDVITTSEISVPVKIDLQQMYLLQLFQRALAHKIAIGTSNKRIFGFKVPFVNDYAFFVKTLYLGTVMVKYKRDGGKCVPEIIQLNKIPHGWRIDDDKKPLDGITIFDFYQGDLKKANYFMEKKTVKKINPILFGSKGCVNLKMESTKEKVQ